MVLCRLQIRNRKQETGNRNIAFRAAFAMEIDQDGSDNNIFFLFQHAEETGDGAKEPSTTSETARIMLPCTLLTMISGMT